MELGETLEQALVREVLEETGLLVKPREVVAVFDRIHSDADHVDYHYVIVDYLCDYVGGEARAASDAEAVALVAPEDLPAYDLPEKALEVVRDGFRRVDLRVGKGLALGQRRE